MQQGYLSCFVWLIVMFSATVSAIGKPGILGTITEFLKRLDPVACPLIRFSLFVIAALGFTKYVSVQLEVIGDDSSRHLSAGQRAAPTADVY